MSPLLDFDELLLKVRSPAARAHIGDAVAAFRAGALRPAVVATWSAVVFDIMAKIREIELTGDARARQQVEQFDAIRRANDVERSLAMERTILDVARDAFEFLTPQEYIDLARLREDRHRCAHPAMNTAEEPYQPSAELVRYHITSALTHLLVQVPVQGKAALARLMSEVNSPLFPTDVAGATRVLSGGPLQRPKDVLVRDFVLATIKATLRGGRATDDAFVARALAAVAAVGQMHPTVVHSIFAADVPRVLGGVHDDEEVARVLRLGVSLPAVWEQMPAAVRTKIERLVEVVNIEERPDLFVQALRTPALRADAEARAAGMERDALVALFRHDGHTATATRPLVARAVELLVGSTSWNATNSLVANVLLPNAAALTDADLERIAVAADANVEVRNAHGTLGLFWAIRDADTIALERFLKTIFRHDLGPRFPTVLEDIPPSVLAAARGDTVALSPGDRVRHPTHGEGVVVEVTGTGDDEKVKIDFEDGWGGSRRSVMRALSRLDVLR